MGTTVITNAIDWEECWTNLDHRWWRWCERSKPWICYNELIKTNLYRMCVLNE